MKRLSYLLLIFSFIRVQAQDNHRPDSLNTARACSYMTAKERDMIYEINRLRSDPRSYLQYIEPMLKTAEENLKENGKGGRNYSLTTTMYDGGRKQIDTTWHYINEEEVHALTTLVEDLKKLGRLSILKPDAGIYKAAAKHARDQAQHEWTLGHTGTDGSAPWDRITKYSPGMSFGNENIAGNSMIVTARDIVLQLLVDSGIPGYGHRYNILDPQWSHVACKGERFKGHMDWWIQDFGVKKKAR